jgi:serine/threonine protein kinase
MEYAQHGNLLNYINKRGRLTEELARRYFAELISVLDYLHNQSRVAHRDIKCENLLFDEHNNIRVIDFGLSNVFTPDNPKLQTACGSPSYVAPEIIQGQSYTHSADIWSSGIVLYAMCSGTLPFDDDDQQRLLGKIVFCEPAYPSFFSPALVDLLEKMICKDTDTRITIDGVKNHPWFSQTRYWALLHEVGQGGWDSTGSGADWGIDHEIIGTMTALGLDCHELHQSLLNSEFTDLTVLYNILRREKLCERNKDLFARMPTTALMMKAAGTNSSIFRPKPHGGSGRQGSPLPKYDHMPPVAQSPLAKNQIPTFSGPVGRSGAGRRLSRPQAARPSVVADQKQVAAGHEAP